MMSISCEPHDLVHTVMGDSMSWQNLLYYLKVGKAQTYHNTELNSKEKTEIENLKWQPCITLGKS